MRTCFASACAAIVPLACCTSAISYAFGAGAPPPAAGAAPAAFSSAAFTEWPLKVRVGANSPSLCPIICSVTYTGMNFRPLCTAMVWPIISGRMVDRRDHVLITFFSLRAFIPSTFSRRWPSMNGPFFSERAIVSPYRLTLLSCAPAYFSAYSSTRRHFTHCARRTLRNPRTGPGTRCDTGQNGHTKRVPWALGVFSTVTAHPGLHSRYSTCTGTTGAKRLAGFTALTAGRGAGRAARAALRVRDTRRAAGRDRVDRDALIMVVSTSPQIPAAPG